MVRGDLKILGAGFLTDECRIINPLSGISKEDLRTQVSQFCAQNGLEGDEAEFQKGALVAQNPLDFEDLEELDEEDKHHLRREITSECPLQFRVCYMTHFFEVIKAANQSKPFSRPMAPAERSLLYHCRLLPWLGRPVSHNLRAT